MSKVCQITNKKANNGYSISHSHVRVRKIQNINLQHKKIWSNKSKSWIRLKISTKGIKSINKIKF